MRWVPAKRKQMGQAGTPMVPSMVQEQAASKNNGAVLEKVIYGGLILAGAAAFITFVFGKD